MERALTNMSTTKEKQQFLEMVSQKRYLDVLRELNNGADPDGSWRGMLPLRTAVLIGDPDMVAILSDAHADPTLEPFLMEYPEGDDVPEDAEPKRVVLGKGARGMAAEMAADVSNPLHREAKVMLHVMADKEEARKRVVALHGRLEVELADEIQTARMRLIYSLLFCIVAGLVYWFILRPMEGNGDEREL